MQSASHAGTMISALPLLGNVDDERTGVWKNGGRTGDYAKAFLLGLFPEHEMCGIWMLQNMPLKWRRS